MRNNLFYILILIVGITGYSCKKYLDTKPDKSLVIPEKLSDLQAIIDNDGVMNQQESEIAEVAADNFYITPTFYPILPTIDQDTYSWNPEVRSDQTWINTYLKIYMANLILDNIDKVKNETDDQTTYNSIKGAAYFIRGLSLFIGTQVYTMPYNSASNNDPLGMSIKTSSDINSPTTRSTLSETYNQIISDLVMANRYLPIEVTPMTRPNKVASYVIMSNVYLVMQNYEMAGKYADSCLLFKSDLMDFNLLDSNSINPIPRGNKEILYESTLTSSNPLNSFFNRVDSDLYKSYSLGDLRRVIFYSLETDSTATFKGGYDNNIGGQALYSGASVDEAYLIKAECAARLGDLDGASSALNKLLSNRYKSENYKPYHFDDKMTAVKLILGERRKELAFRGGRRWWDLRRLNLDPNFAVTLKRNISGTVVDLQPNDFRYAFLLPEATITIGNLKQNTR